MTTIKEEIEKRIITLETKRRDTDIEINTLYKLLHDLYK